LHVCFSAVLLVSLAEIAILQISKVLSVCVFFLFFPYAALSFFVVITLLVLYLCLHYPRDRGSCIGTRRSEKSPVFLYIHESFFVFLLGRQYYALHPFLCVCVCFIAPHGFRCKELEMDGDKGRIHAERSVPVTIPWATRSSPTVPWGRKSAFAS
jgi:hypothetical protein